MKKVMLQWGDLWCQMTHTGSTWPLHGAYRCRQCHRVRSVEWANDANRWRKQSTPAVNEPKARERFDGRLVPSSVALVR
jgi:hypothetical protein